MKRNFHFNFNVHTSDNENKRNEKFPLQGVRCAFRSQDTRQGP